LASEELLPLLALSCFAFWARALVLGVTDRTLGRGDSNPCGDSLDLPQPGRAFRMLLGRGLSRLLETERHPLPVQLALEPQFLPQFGASTVHGLLEDPQILLVEVRLADVNLVGHSPPA
jgi:hypothetical protein